MLRRIRGHIWCRAGGTATAEPCNFGLVSVPKGTTPTTAEFVDESALLWSQNCICSRGNVTDLTFDNPGELHFDLSLSLKVPLDRSLFFSMENDGTITNFLAFWIRLFWSLI